MILDRTPLGWVPQWLALEATTIRPEWLALPALVAAAYAIVHLTGRRSA